MIKIFTLCFLLFSFSIQAQSNTLLPGKIEAEAFTAMHAVGTENTSDADGGLNVGWIQDGSWMDYAVQAPSAGYYTFKFRIANGYNPEATLALQSAGGTTLGRVILPQTGGMQGWQTVSFVALLPQGSQTIRIFAEKGGWNFNWFEISGSRALASGKVEAESFDAMHEVRTEDTGDEGGGQNVGYIDDNDWMDYNLSLANARDYEIQFRVANAYGNGIIEIQNAAGNVLGQVSVPQTGGWQNWVTVTTTVALPAGSQVVRFFARNGAFNFNWFAFVSANARITGTILPAKVEAETFNDSYSVQLQNTEDTDGGQNVEWIQDNSWMDYDVHVPAAGIFTFNYRIANGYSPEATLALKNSDGIELGSILLPQTGGMQGWKTVSMLAALPAGNQKLRVFATKGGWNFNWFEAKESRTLTSRIEAETFDVASDVRTEVTGDVDGDINVNYIDDSDWMDYNVNVPTAGTYTVNFRVSNQWGNGNIQFKNTNGTVLGSVDVPQTGGWQTYTTVRTTVQLEAGSQVFRIFANRGAFNFNWFEVIPGSVQGQSVITFEPISDKNLTAGSFNLTASSTNPETPIQFTSSNPSIVSVSNASGIWKASIHSAGQATITASQAGNNNYLTAENIARTFTISDNSNPNNPALGTKIPIDPKRWYQLTNAANGLDGLFDGNTQENVLTGWGKVINNYEAYYPLKEGEQITLNGIKFFDFTGSAQDFPLVLSVITDQWERIPVATFTGEIYNGWVGPYPDRQLSGDAQFKLDQPMSNIRYLVMTMSNTLPTEIEFYGSHTPGTETVKPARTKHIKLNDMLGVNGYEWYFQDGAHTESLVEAKVQAAKTFTGLRHYMDWEKLESTEGVFSYNPTLSGSWNYDLIYERCKQEGIEVLACLKTQPNWMMQTYPEDQRDPENVPVRYGKNFADPLSYIEQAKVAFQYAARYGSNVNVDPSLLSVSTTPRWTNDPVNEVKIGLNYIKYIECDNERDKWWKGRKGYQTAREYAANMSAFYDGHKNSMGAGVGVKNADPNMKVVIAGLVTGPDFVKGMVDWCKEFRGYNADGTVNLCWDVVNFHLYTDDASSNQSGTSTRGAAPEVTNANVLVDNYVKVTRELSNDQPIWLTEAGYDLSPESPLKAIAIGNKSVQQTQADWILRTSLFSARHGVEKVFYYQMYDNGGWGMFSTSGFVNDDQTRRPSADYFLQTQKLFGQYEYKETLHNDPIVDRYELNGQSLFILTVPDEVGRTAEYTVNLNQSGVARIYTPTAGADNMAMNELPIVDGKVTVTVGETPIFVIAANGQNARQAAVEIAAPVAPEEASLHADARVFPNPTSDFVRIDLANDKTGQIGIRIFDAKSGTLYKDLKVNKTASQFAHQLDITQLPPSIYIVEIVQGNDRAFRKIAKVN
ncbi:Por secretion system C-terminal sorting domain-containing protein [Dyadobacter soli]|uniref:Por secretion system C-terminal sorting domain-containing protein n=1 Tax=Dyadobacter soli TaxID=659014 RepID=A0A1G7JLS9_9BACT|nr:carbohydrate-binding protein [Dyadobacter soli]SDF25897.1 Por secretion system C-terminal sorting domain-containing protein [Dyadobacter soli]